MLKMSETKELTPLKDNMLKSGLRLVTWNIVTDCTPECCLYEKCSKKQDGTGCVVEKDYLNCIMEPVFKYLENELDEYDLVELGIKYLRLHHNLVRVQKEILGSGVIETHPYGMRVNPLLSEERALLQAIEALDINKLLRMRVKTKVKEITSGIQLGDGTRSTVIEVLDDSDTNYTDRLAGKQ